MTPTTITAGNYEEYAFNLLVNEMENGNLRDGYKTESENGSLQVNLVGDEYIIAIRSYVKNIGWLSVEFIQKK